MMHKLNVKPICYSSGVSECAFLQMQSSSLEADKMSIICHCYHPPACYLQHQHYTPPQILEHQVHDLADEPVCTHAISLELPCRYWCVYPWGLCIAHHNDWVVNNLILSKGQQRLAILLKESRGLRAICQLSDQLMWENWYQCNYSPSELRSRFKPCFVPSSLQPFALKVVAREPLLKATAARLCARHQK